MGMVTFSRVCVNIFIIPPLFLFPSFPLNLSIMIRGDSLDAIKVGGRVPISKKERKKSFFLFSSTSFSFSSITINVTFLSDKAHHNG